MVYTATMPTPVDHAQPLNKINDNHRSLGHELADARSILDPAQFTDKTELTREVPGLREEIKQMDLARCHALLDCRDAWREHLDARKEMAVLRNELNDERKQRTAAEMSREAAEECASRLCAQLALEQGKVADLEERLRAKDDETINLKCTLNSIQWRAETSTAALRHSEQQAIEQRRTISRLEDEDNRSFNTIKAQGAELVAQRRRNDQLTIYADDLERSCRRFARQIVQLEGALKHEEQANRVLERAGNALQQRNRDLESEVAGWGCVADDDVVEAMIEEGAQDGELVDHVVAEYIEYADASTLAAIFDTDADWEENLAGVSDLANMDDDSDDEVEEEPWYDCDALD